MLKINLEKELLKVNHKLLTDKDLLVIKETDKFLSEKDLAEQNKEILKRSGFRSIFYERDSIDKKNPNRRTNL